MQASREFDSLFWGGGSGPQRRPDRPQVQANAYSPSNTHNHYYGQTSYGTSNGPQPVIRINTGSANQGVSQPGLTIPPLRSAPNSFPALSASSAPYLVPAGYKPNPGSRYLQPPPLSHTGNHHQPPRDRQDALFAPYPISPGVPHVRPSTASPSGRRPSPHLRPATTSPPGRASPIQQRPGLLRSKSDTARPSREHSGDNYSNSNIEPRSQRSDKDQTKTDRSRADVSSKADAKGGKEKKSKTSKEKVRGDKTSKKGKGDASRKAGGRKGKSGQERRTNVKPEQPPAKPVPPAIAKLPEWPQAGPVEWSDQPDERRPRPVVQRKPQEKKKKKKKRWWWS